MRGFSRGTVGALTVITIALLLADIGTAAGPIPGQFDREHAGTVGGADVVRSGTGHDSAHRSGVRTGPRRPGRLALQRPRAPSEPVLGTSALTGPIPAVGNISVPAVRSWATNLSGPSPITPGKLTSLANGRYAIQETVGGSTAMDGTAKGRVSFVNASGRVATQDVWRRHTSTTGVAKGGGSVVVAGNEMVPRNRRPKLPGAVVKRYTADGAVEWTARPHHEQVNPYKNSGPIIESQAWAVAQTADGGAVVTGDMIKRKGDDLARDA